MPSCYSLLPVLLVVLHVASCQVPVSEDSASHRVDVVTVEVDPETGSPILLLRERAGLRRELPIWIGRFEALSIALATEGIPPPRPNSHDLIKNLLDKVEGHLSRVVVTELRGTTYYAVIELIIDGDTVEVDSRPSDAIAVAIRTDTPIYANDEVLRKVEVSPGGEGAVDIDWLRRSRPAPLDVQENASRPNA